MNDLDRPVWSTDADAPAMLALAQLTQPGPFLRRTLHAWTTNRAAIALYERLGFGPRTEVDVAVLQRPA